MRDQLGVVVRLILPDRVRDWEGDVDLVAACDGDAPIDSDCVAVTDGEADKDGEGDPLEVAT